MAEKWYLRVDGIDGDSKATGHEKSIDILAWSWGVAHAAPSGAGTGTGAATGKASFRDFDFVTYISKASPALFVACASGRHIPYAELTGVRGGAKSAAFLVYKLSDVLLTGVNHADDEDGAPVEEFSLQYRKIEITYTPQKASGKVGTATRAGWDLAQNKQF